MWVGAMILQCRRERQRGQNYLFAPQSDVAHKLGWNARPRYDTLVSYTAACGSWTVAGTPCGNHGEMKYRIPDPPNSKKVFDNAANL